jgi:hypothetical protein
VRKRRFGVAARVRALRREAAKLKR